jgi:hypothetical protein
MLFLGSAASNSKIVEIIRYLCHLILFPFLNNNTLFRWTGLKNVSKQAYRNFESSLKTGNRIDVYSYILFYVNAVNLKRAVVPQDKQ